jgi:Transglycosylase SLT domain
MTAQPPQRRRRSVWYRVLSVIVFTLIPVAGFCDQTPQTQPATAPGDVLISQPNWLIRQSALCDAALLRAETRYQLPHQLLTSIARVESGRPITSLADTRPWPWTIDADGMGLFVDSKAAAIAWMTTQAAHHNFVDVGCMQVDLYYHPHAFASLEEAFDPVANADYAARLLLELYRGEAGGNWDLAVGLYHSHTSLLAAEYRDRVAMVGADVLHGTLRTMPLYVRAIHQGTLQLQLANGKVTLLNVHRQPARRSPHPYSACQIEQILGPYLAGPRRGTCGPSSPPRAAAALKADAAR